MHIFAILQEKIIAIVQEMQAQGQLPADAVLPFGAITAEPPRDPLHGDIATNVAMVLAKPASMNPRALAELLVPKITALPEVQNATIAGPGFINLTLHHSIWYALIATILSDKISYGNSDLGQQKPVNIEYVSANPTGPMHVGHLRNAIVGDVLARLLQKVGYNVTKEFYINDAGSQVEVLARSVELRYREALGETIGAIPEGLYPGDYLKPVGESLASYYQNALLDLPEAERMEKIKAFSLDAMMALIKHDLLGLDIVHDVFSSEKALADRGAVEAAFQELNKKGFIYQGTLPPPKGKVVEDWEPTELTLFKASEFGDDGDRPLKNSHGKWTYFAPDIAYHYDKLQRGFQHMILVLGADHAGYQKRLGAAVNALSDGKAQLDILLYQLVNLMENGEPVKMSKRAGTFVTVQDVVERVGKDVVRFIMMTRKHTEMLEFDFKKVLEQTKDNPVFYVQYAHARVHSVLRNAPGAAADVDNIDATALALLTHPAEIMLIRKMAEWPRVVESAAETLEPHRIAYYLYDLASHLHGLWNAGKDDTTLRFIIEQNQPLTLARLALIKACSITIASGLNVLGVEPVTAM